MLLDLGTLIVLMNGTNYEPKLRKGKMRNAYKILVGKPEGKRPLGRPRHR
jgi:hypothetical protein